MANLKFDNMFDEVLKLLDEEIIKAEQKIINKPIMQLRIIKQEVLIMKRVKNPKEFKPSYGMPIVDSWDYSDKLGIMLMELASLYERIRK